MSTVSLKEYENALPFAPDLQPGDIFAYPASTSVGGYAWGHTTLVMDFVEIYPAIWIQEETTKDFITYTVAHVQQIIKRMKLENITWLPMTPRKSLTISLYQLEQINRNWVENGIWLYRWSSKDLEILCPTAGWFKAHFGIEDPDGCLSAVDVVECLGPPGSKCIREKMTLYNKPMHVIRFIGDEKIKTKVVELAQNWMEHETKKPLYCSIWKLLPTPLRSCFVAEKDVRDNLKTLNKFMETNPNNVLLYKQIFDVIENDVFCSEFVASIWQIALFLYTNNISCMPVNARYCLPQDLLKLPKQLPKCWQEIKYPSPATTVIQFNDIKAPNLTRLCTEKIPFEPPVFETVPIYRASFQNLTRLYSQTKSPNPPSLLERRVTPTVQSQKAVIKKIKPPETLIDKTMLFFPCCS